MDIFGTSELGNLTVSRPITRHALGEEPRTVESEVPYEHTLHIFINDIPTLRIVCTPRNLFDLVVGRLFTQGIISSVKEIESIHLEGDNTKALVRLVDAKADFDRKSVQVTPTTGAGNRILNNYFEKETDLSKVTPIPWEPEWIFSLASKFAEDTPMHKATFGTHSCYLAQQDKILFCCEDLGRHNAFDKAIGFALRNNIDLSRCIIFSSGRLPVDMIAKGIRSAIPILVSKAVPTATTIDLAKQYDLTLICSAHPDSMNVFNNPIAELGEQANA